MQTDIISKYTAGINIGGWISQCKYQKEHIATFIGKEDIARIASWGMDHVRLPFDYPVLEDDNHPYEYLEDGFAVIDRLISWCKEYGLNVVLDMHKAPGYAFYNAADDEKLFTDLDTQNRFISLWMAIAKRYIGEGDHVIFELMNEIKDPHGDTWNRIARAAIEGIREIDPNRYILLGGPHYNAVTGLDTLEIWDDERIIYNFHFYEPFLFTHQRAPWTHLKNTTIHQPYPGKIEGVDQLNQLYQHDGNNASLADTVFDKAFLAEKLAPALAFQKRTGKMLYCGEYGPIDLADMESRVNWLQDLTALFNENHIGRAYWTYKGMNFSSIDKQGDPVSAALVQAIASR